MNNYRYDEFLNQDQSILITGEAIKVPSGSPYYVPLLEVPREESPSTLLVRAAGSSTTVNPDQDCQVDQSAPTTNGNGITADVGRDASGSGGWLHRIFIRFNIAALPSSAALAKLRIWSSNPHAPAVIGIHKVTGSWTETGPTWNSQPAYDAVATGQYSLPGDIPNTSTGPGWYEADITALYNAWKSSGINNGLMLKADESVFDTRCQITTKDNGSLQPQLVVVSTGNYYTEVARTIAPGPGQFAVHYGTGRLRFHSGAAGVNLEVDYRGFGSPIDAAHTTYWGGTTGGTSSAYTLSIPAISQLVPGQMVQAKVHTSVAGAATLNINGLGACPILRFSTALTAAQLVTNGVYTFLYDSGNFHVQGV